MAVKQFVNIFTSHWLTQYVCQIFVRSCKVTWKKQGGDIHSSTLSHHTLKTEGIRGSFVRQKLLLLKLSAKWCSTLNKPFSQTDNMVRKYRDRQWVKWKLVSFHYLSMPIYSCTNDTTYFQQLTASLNNTLKKTVAGIERSVAEIYNINNWH